MSKSLTKLYLHVVFSTKGRTDTLPKTHLKEVHAYIAEILNRYDSQALCVGGTANHVHILFVLNKNMSLSEAVRIVKANSSRFINEKNGMMDVPFCWQNGYGAFSISQSHVADVRRYIEKQEEHHAKVDFKDELRRLCGLYGIEIEEPYIWN